MEEMLGSSKRAFVLGARETVRGFQLIGVEGKEVSNASEALEILEKAIEEKYSLIIISASTAEEIQDTIDVYRIEEETPIIVVSDVNTPVDKKDLEKQFRKFIGL